MCDTPFFPFTSKKSEMHTGFSPLDVSVMLLFLALKTHKANEKYRGKIPSLQKPSIYCAMCILVTDVLRPEHLCDIF